MILGFSSKNKWYFYNSSCFEYVNFFKDMTDGDIYFVLDSDLREFCNDYSNELKDELIVRIKDCEVTLL